MGILPVLLLGVLGCVHPQARLQSADDSAHDKEPEVKTIGDITGFSNVDPIPVSGVGLVVGLDGTGGDAPPGEFRRMLEAQLAQIYDSQARDLLTSPNTSMVMVSALIPAGAHKGDPIDVQITLPQRSRTTSLRGGYLQECPLTDYNSTKMVDPNFNGSNKLLKGHTLAVAKGRLLVGMGAGDEATLKRQGLIWEGGRSKIDRPLVLVLNSGQQRAPVAVLVAQRINEAFHGVFQGNLSEIAHPTTEQIIYLKVPQQYRLNLPRYMRVVRLIPLQETAASRGPYRRRLAKQLLNPVGTVTAALRLEALGTENIPVLKTALKSDHPLVRFCSAEALAYLGDPACGQELGKLAEEQPDLRAYCLTALASLDESISHVVLSGLVDSPNPETRYGAFRALQALDERDPLVRGELLNDSFWLHRVSPHTVPLVHISATRRAEIVLFGQEPELVPPFSFWAGEFTLTASRDDHQCTLSRFSVHHGTSRQQCSLKVADMLHTLADLGGMYPEAVELLRQAGDCQCMTCPIGVDRLPQGVSVFDLAQKGDELLQLDREARRQLDLGPTPALFAKGPVSRPGTSTDADKQASLPDKPGHERLPAAPAHGGIQD